MIKEFMSSYLKRYEVFRMSPKLSQMMASPGDMTLVDTRRETFENSNIPKSAQRSLALDGFVLMKPGHKVMCIYCGQEYKTEPYKSLLHVHKLKSPNCQMHNFNELHKISINTFGLVKDVKTIHINRSVNLLKSSDKYYTAAYQHFISLEKRIKSYDSCEIPEIIERKEEYARNGLIFMFSDILVCYYCGGCLCNFENEYKEVTKMHRFFFPHCIHLKLIESPSVIDEAKQLFLAYFSIQSTPRQLHNSLYRVADNAIVRFGEYVELHYVPFVRLINLSPRFLYARNTITQCKISDFPNAEESSGNKCIICLDNISTILLIPCNHLVSCVSCFVNINGRTCPFCKSVIQDIIKVFHCT
ncbi:apoptosis inhibitor [Callinectes sapidus nudivirus]|nr:apoptosis inhibitor [Callinectes sapidus nudivirus]